MFGVNITRRVVIRSEPTLFTSAILFERSPKRMVPKPGTATEWPSVAHALITSPMASQAALMAPLAIPERSAASLITLLCESLLYRSACSTYAHFSVFLSNDTLRSTALTLIAIVKNIFNTLVQRYGFYFIPQRVVRCGETPLSQISL